MERVCRAVSNCSVIKRFKAAPARKGGGLLLFKGVKMVTVNQIAKLVNGEVFGDGEVRISGMMSPEFTEEGDLTFALSAEELEKVSKSKAACVL